MHTAHKMDVIRQLSGIAADYDGFEDKSST